jgi:hypothetical protein
MGESCGIIMNLLKEPQTNKEYSLTVINSPVVVDFPWRKEAKSSSANPSIM